MCLEEAVFLDDAADQFIQAARILVVKSPNIPGFVNYVIEPGARYHRLKFTEVCGVGRRSLSSVPFPCSFKAVADRCTQHSRTFNHEHQYSVGMPFGAPHRECELIAIGAVLERMENREN